MDHQQNEEFEDIPPLALKINLNESSSDKLAISIFLLSILSLRIKLSFLFSPSINIFFLLKK